MITTLDRLPGPNSDFWDWQMHGTCRGLDSAVFFHPEGERGQARAQRERRAKQVCAECPVLAQCRSHALSVDEPYGIWGGLTESERNLIRRRTPSNRTPGRRSNGLGHAS